MRTTIDTLLRRLHFLWPYRWLIFGAALLVLVVIAPTVYAKFATSGERYDGERLDELKQVPKRQYAIVFGAGVQPNGTPTPYLQHHIETAVDLYKTGRVERLLMTGDNSEEHYNEPVVMKRHAVQLGVPEDRITLDYAGFSTYDSCYRAWAIFDIHNAIVVTQGYHLPRAMMTCDGLGVHVVGVAAKREGRRDHTAAYIMREYLSSMKAVLELWAKPMPDILGGPELIH